MTRCRFKCNYRARLAGSSVPSIEWAHTEEYFVLKELGYRIAQHAARLLRIVQLAAFALTVLLLAAAMAGWPRAAILSVFALLQFLGMLVERWLLFTEVKHTVTLYYGR
jgi:sulfite dehydrogenase (quinone) subunit SoeC